MKCLGITKKKKRCGNAARWFFCGTHWYQGIILLVITIPNIIAIYAGIYQDIWLHFFGPETPEVQISLSPQPLPASFFDLPICDDANIKSEKQMGELLPGQTVQGQIDAPGEAHVYKLTTTKFGVPRIRALAVGGNRSTLCAIRTETDGNIIEGPISLGGYISTLPEVAATSLLYLWTEKTESEKRAERNDYHLRFTDYLDETSDPITSRDHINEELPGLTNPYHYQFTANAGDHVSLVVHNQGTSLKTTVALYSLVENRRTRIAESSINTGHILNASLPDRGDYKVLIENPEANRGTFTFCYQNFSPQIALASHRPGPRLANLSSFAPGINRQAIFQQTSEKGTRLIRVKPRGSEASVYHVEDGSFAAIVEDKDRFLHIAVEPGKVPQAIEITVSRVSREKRTITPLETNSITLRERKDFDIHEIDWIEYENLLLSEPQGMAGDDLCCITCGSLRVCGCFVATGCGTCCGGCC